MNVKLELNLYCNATVGAQPPKISDFLLRHQRGLEIRDYRVTHAIGDGCDSMDNLQSIERQPDHGLCMRPPLTVPGISSAC